MKIDYREFVLDKKCYASKFERKRYFLKVGMMPQTFTVPTIRGANSDLQESGDGGCGDFSLFLEDLAPSEPNIF